MVAIQQTIAQRLSLYNQPALMNDVFISVVRPLNMDELWDLGIISDVSADWWRLGCALDLSSEHLKIIESRAPTNIRRCAQVFQHWIDNGSYPPSWDRLCSVLRRIGRSDVANNIIRQH